MAYTSRADLAKAVRSTTEKPADSAEKQPGCSECFKDGWPPDSTSVGCEHGMWVRGQSAVEQVDP